MSVHPANGSHLLGHGLRGGVRAAETLFRVGRVERLHDVAARRSARRPTPVPGPPSGCTITTRKSANCPVAAHCSAGGPPRSGTKRLSESPSSTIGDAGRPDQVEARGSAGQSTASTRSSPSGSTSPRYGPASRSHSEAGVDPGTARRRCGQRRHAVLRGPGRAETDGPHHDEVAATPTTARRRVRLACSLARPARPEGSTPSGAAASRAARRRCSTSVTATHRPPSGTGSTAARSGPGSTGSSPCPRSSRAPGPSAPR